MMTRMDMKRTLWLLGFAACAGAAAACGGVPPRSIAQASRYQASLNWPGGPGAFGGNTSFGITDMLVTIPFAGTRYQDAGLVTNQTSFGVGLAPPSPLPTGVPTETPQPPDLVQIRNNPVTWSASGAGVAITPEPQWNAMLGPTVLVAAGSNTGKSILTATAVGPPVNVGVSITVYTYRVADIGCVDPGALGGAAFAPDSQGGHYVPQSDPKGSDLYVTGPQCSGAFADPSATTYTLHVPYGGTLLNTDGTPVNEQNNLFFTLSPQVWKPAFTQLNEQQFQALYAPCSLSPDPRMCFTPPNDVLVFKTRAGDIVKMYTGTTYHATTSGRNVTGAFEVSANGSFVF